MNTVHLVGKVASEIRTREFIRANGSLVKASFILVVPRPRRDADPDWVRVETWGKQAENLVKYNSKGSRLAVRGRLRGEFWNPDGGNRGGELRCSVVAEEITYLGGGRTSTDTAAATTPPASSTERRR